MNGLKNIQHASDFNATNKDNRQRKQFSLTYN